jgi:hypothetical protein
VCRDGSCYNPCGSDDDCSTWASSGRPTCNLDTGECVCSEDAHCADVLYVSVCNTETGKCECANDADCTEADTVNTDVCVEGRCGCSSDTVCTADTNYDATTWICE